MRRRIDQRGFTLIEMLAVMSILGIVSVGFYTLLFSGARSSNVARSVTQTSEEARLGFNRMVRDIREAKRVVSATPTEVKVEVDFDGDGVIVPAPSPNASGDYEDLTFTFDEGAGTIRLNGSLLMAGVSKIGASELFTYSSNKLQYDYNNDGVVTLTELNTAVASGASIGTVLDNVTNVSIALRVSVEGRTADFYSQAELRNRR